MNIMSNPQKSPVVPQIPVNHMPRCCFEAGYEVGFEGESSEYFEMDENLTFENFISSLKFTEEYLHNFKDTGFDDVELIKTMDAEEKQQMFDIVGLSKKPDHLSKFKKALSSLEKPSIDIVEGTNDINTTPTTNKPACVKRGKAQSSKWISYISLFVLIFYMY